MKKRLLSVISLILSIVTLLPLSSCSKIPETPVLSYGGNTISDAVYKYLCCIEKTEFLYEIYGKSRDDTKASELQDRADMWALIDEDNNTLADTLKESVLSKMKLTLYLAKYALDNGYSVTEEFKSNMKKQLDDIVNKYPSRDFFNETVSAYGVNYNILYNYYILDGLSSLGEYILFGENGKMKVSEADARKFFDENYITVNAFFVNTKNKTYPNGKVVYLPEEEVKEKKRLADECEQKLLAGEDFLALSEKYADSSMGLETGYTFMKNDFGNVAVEEKVATMKSGEWARIDIDEGIFFIKRIPLDSTQFTGDSDAIITIIENSKKNELVKAVDSEFVLNKEPFDALDIASIQHAQ